MIYLKMIVTLICVSASLPVSLPAIAAPAQSVKTDACQHAPLALQVLGSGGPEFGDQRASSSYLIWHNGKARILIDMGGGAALRFEQSGARIEDLSAIAFTHLHVDHSADFPALVKASYFSDRTQELPVFGPEGNKLLPSMTGFTEALFGKSGAWPYLGDLFDVGSNSNFHFSPVTVKTNKDKVQSVYNNKQGLKLSAITTHHGPLPALAWRVDAGETGITFSGDMNGDLQSLPRLAQGSRVLVAHNAVPESAAGSARELHMPPSTIGEIGAQASVGVLVLSHRMSRTLATATETRQLIDKRYKGEVRFANDLDCIVISPTGEKP